MTATENTTSNLIEAIHAGKLSDVIKALNEGSDIEMQDMHGYPGLPLRTACFEGNPAIVRELLTLGANVNAASNDGPGAPLRLALRKGHQDVVAVLLQYGAQMPESIAANPAPAGNGRAPMLDEPVVPPATESKPDSNIIEFSTHDTSGHETVLTTDDSDTPSQFGTETNVLSMDLLFLEENEAHHAPPRTKNTP